MTKDYLPHGDVPFYEWVKNFLIYVLMYLVKWGLPAGCADRLNELLGKYKLALEVAHDARHSTQDIEKKNEAKEELMAEVRYFVGMYIVYNKNITSDERKVCGLPIYDNTWTPSPDPTTFPVKKKVVRLAEGRIGIYIQDSATGESTKPDGVHGWEILYVVSTQKAMHRDEMTKSTFVTHNPAVLQFDDHQLGMILSFTIRYENTRGVKGPWSEIYYIIIS
jgi:hypothetical protein